MSKEDRHAYDEHINAVMIQNDVLSGAKLEGLIEGRAEGKIEGKMEIVCNLKKMGLPIETIMQATGLSAEEIEKLEV